MWSAEQAQVWYRDQPWLVGCNFIPSTAVNSLEMWQADTFDPASIDRELGWASSLGFNVLRVFLHDLLWARDPAGVLQRIDHLLEIADKWNHRVMFVLFDDNWISNPKAGLQPRPVTGRYNSQWVQSPGLEVLNQFSGDAFLQHRLQAYVQGVVQSFADDHRVLAWDIYNEPGTECRLPDGRKARVGDECLALLESVFDWVEEIRPSQPFTSGIYDFGLLDGEICQLQLGRSEIISFHSYGDVQTLAGLVNLLRTHVTDRPLFCTEFLARTHGSRFQTHLPMFKEYDIAAFSRGLVAGRTQTHFDWETWESPLPSLEPAVWHQDIFRWDGSPFDREEITRIRSVTWRDSILQETVEFLETKV